MKKIFIPLSLIPTFLFSQAFVDFLPILEDKLEQKLESEVHK